MKMDILEKIRLNALEDSGAIALRSNETTLTYGQLEAYSNRLAAYIEDVCKNDKTPLVVYGHKSPYMVVSFLACVKSGRAYCPVDVSVPETRVQAILDAVDGPMALAVESMETECKGKLNLKEIQRISWNYERNIDRSKRVKPEDVFYIIFTSGSTGAPKGVQITTE